MKLEVDDIKECYKNRHSPRKIKEVITNNDTHFTDQQYKPEFIKANVNEVFQKLSKKNQMNTTISLGEESTSLSFGKEDKY